MRIGREKQNRIALLGVTRNTDNYGVRVLLSSAIELLSITHPGREIILVDYGREAEEWTETTGGNEYKIRLINLRFSWRLHLPNNVFRLVAVAALSRAIPAEKWRLRFLGRNPWLAEILATGAHYSISGGDSFSDIYGLMRFLYVALPQILVLLVGRPLVLLPQTYGPFRGAVTRVLAAWILRRAQAIFSRDTAGIESVRTLTGADGPKVQLSPDLGFFMKPEPLATPIIDQVEDLRKQGPVVGLNVSSLLYMGGYTGDNMFQLRESFPELISALADYIVQELHAQVILVPHVCGGSQEDETSLCERLETELGERHGECIHYLRYSLNHRHTKSLIGQCDFFIGARMHACIAAVSMGVPCVCLAYSQKFAGVMQPFGAGATVADLRKLTIPEVLAAAGSNFRERERLGLELRKVSPNFDKTVGCLRSIGT